MTNLTNFQRDMLYCDPSTMMAGGGSGAIAQLVAQMDGVSYSDTGHGFMTPRSAAIAANNSVSIGVCMAGSGPQKVPYRVQIRGNGNCYGAVAFIQAAEVTVGNVTVNDFVWLGPAYGPGIDAVLCFEKDGDFLPFFMLAQVEQSAQVQGGYVSVQRCIVQPPEYASAVS